MQPNVVLIRTSGRSGVHTACKELRASHERAAVHRTPSRATSFSKILQMTLPIYPRRSASVQDSIFFVDHTTSVVVSFRLLVRDSQVLLNTLAPTDDIWLELYLRV